MDHLLIVVQAIGKVYFKGSLRPRRENRLLKRRTIVLRARLFFSFTMLLFSIKGYVRGTFYTGDVNGV